MMEDTQQLSIYELERLYLQTFSDKEKKAYLIAKDQLGMSYQTDKSIGFIEWKQKYYPSN
jgi:hypothetical protein